MTVHVDHEETAPENQNSMRIIYSADILSEFLFRRESHSLIDIGCNSGFLWDHLWDEIFYTGVDADEELIEKARKKYANDMQRVSFYAGDVEDLQFEDEAFDAFYMGEVLEHLEDPYSALKEAYRVLKPGGYGIITTPKKIEGFNPNHTQEYELEAMKKMLKVSNFRIYGISLVSQNPLKWYRLLMVFEVTKE